MKFIIIFLFASISVFASSEGIPKKVMSKFFNLDMDIISNREQFSREFFKEFYEFVPDPEKIQKQFYPGNLFQSNFGESYYFSFIIANLDNDSNPECIFLIGPEKSPNRLFIVLKKGKKEWKIPFYKMIFNKTRKPIIQLYNSIDSGSIFSVSLEYKTSPGIYKSGLEFYKLQDESVYRVLSIITEISNLNHNDIYGIMHSTIEFNESKIGAHYNFSYYTPLVTKNSFNEINFLRKEIVLWHEWNSKAKKFIPKFNEEFGKNKLKVIESIPSVEFSVNDFCDSFNKDLIKNMNSGSLEKKAIRNLLDKCK